MVLMLTVGRAMAHDPRIYHDHEMFKPERYLRSASHEPERNPQDIVFGFGRR